MQHRLNLSVALIAVLLFACATTGSSRVVTDHLYFCAHYLAQGLLDQAEARCELVIELEPDNREAYNLLGLIERHRGNIEKAERFFKKAIALDDDFPAALNNYGEIFADRGEWEDARGLFARALEVDPTYVNARANLAKALYYTGDEERAAKEYLKCTEQNPKHCGCRLGLGVIAADRGDSDRAIAQFERLAQICPGDSMSFYNLCWAYLGVRRCTEAVAACGRAIAIHPDYLEAQAAQAHAAQCVAQQESILAEALARAQAHPRDAELQYKLGRLYEDGQRWAEALTSFNRCLVLDSAHVRAVFHAARVADRLLLAGDTLGLCKRFLERVRGADFDDEKAWCAHRVRELR